MDKFRTIIWDWNGTLLNDVQECLQIINRSLHKRNLPALSLAQYLEKFQFPVKKYYEAIGFDFARESFEEAGQEYMDAYAKKMLNCQLQPKAINTLSSFKRAGLRQFILSALNDEALQKCLSSYNLNDYFVKACGLDDYYAHSKLELGKALIKDYAIDRETAVLIGDTVHDYEAAQAMGISCILIADGHNSKQRLTSCNVPVLDNLDALQQKIVNQSKRLQA